MDIDDRQLEKDAKGVFALPCILPVPPSYYKDGFLVVRACLNTTSKDYPSILDQVPSEWKPDSRSSKRSRGGMPLSFSICMTSDSLPSPDIPYQFVGKVEEHKKYGLQFHAFSFFVDEPNNKRMMELYLQRMPQIKQVRAQEIVNTFGVENIARIIENEWKQLTEIRGITEKRAREIHELWKQDSAQRAVCMWLIKHNVSAYFGKKIIDQFKDHAMDVLEKNPYALTRIRGIGFKTADQIAHKLFDDIPRDLRTESCIEWYLSQQKSKGHTCLPFRLVREEVNQILSERDSTDYVAEIKAGVTEVCHRVVWKEALKSFVYLPGMFRDECTCAEFLVKISRLQSRHTFDNSSLERAEIACGQRLRAHEFTFDENQKLAIESAFANKLTVLTGGGGTGKSTICFAICDIADSMGVHVTLFAPTGQAAKVLADKTKHEASTIHRGLGILPDGTKIPKKDTNDNQDGDGQGSYNAIQPGLLIIDEFSMVGTDLFAHVVRAIQSPEETNVIFVGDPQQLPSVSPGNNLKDVIESGCANVVKLQQIYRQSERSHIPIVANQIARGEVPEIPEESDDFIWVDSSGEDAAKKVLSIVNHYHKQGRMRDVHVISPVYKRNSGVIFINRVIQNAFTTTEVPSLLYGDNLDKINLGDRVMQIVNDYDKGVFNGNVGYVAAYYDDDIGSACCETQDYGKFRPELSRMGADKNALPPETVSPKISWSDSQQEDNDEKEVEGTKSAYIMFEEGGGRVNGIRYSEDDLPDLKLAWCSTVHKFQGSQMPIIVFVMTSDLSFMLSRELVYTAFTRAEEKLFVIGDRRGLRRAADQSVIKARYTHLTTFVNQILGIGEIPIVLAPRKYKLEQDVAESQADDIDD